jgi:hypothetical protein
MLLSSIISVSHAQYQTQGVASQQGPNEFQVTPPSMYVAGAVWNTTQLDLNQDFQILTQMYFGAYDTAADGMAFVLQSAGTQALGNAGAGLGYHNITPSLIVEFDTYSNSDPYFDLGDPQADHLGFLSFGNAYHNHASALQPPVALPVNIEDGAWHDVKFLWNAATKSLTVNFLGQDHVYTGDIVNTIFWHTGSLVWFGFTGSSGHAGNDQRVRILNVATGNLTQPILVTANISPSSCNTGGAIDVSVNGGLAPFTYLWSNGITQQDLSGLQPGSYTITVTDASGISKQETFAVAASNDQTAPALNCPATREHCFNILNLYAVPELIATDNCSLVSVKFAITGATSRSGNGNNASGYFLPGSSTITWTATDASGNSTTCTTIVKVNRLDVSIPDTYAVNPGGAANTIYIGYGPTSLRLTSQVAGGTAPYTYKWSTGAITPSITVNPSRPGAYVYFVVVTDAAGCSYIKTRTVFVTDVRCGNKNDKIQLCHVLPGNPGKPNEICIAKAAVAEHLAHGDYLGHCRNANDDREWDNRSRPSESAGETTAGNKQVYPNPTKGQFQLQLDGKLTGSAEIEVYSPSGSLIEKRTIRLNGAQQAVQFNLTGQPSGMYLVKLVTSNGIKAYRVFIRH